MQFVFRSPACLYLRLRLLCCCLFTGSENIWGGFVDEGEMTAWLSVKSAGIYCWWYRSRPRQRMAVWLHGRIFFQSRFILNALLLWGLLCVTACSGSFFDAAFSSPCCYFLSYMLSDRCKGAWGGKQTKTQTKPHKTYLLLVRMKK